LEKGIEMGFVEETFRRKEYRKQKAFCERVIVAAGKSSRTKGEDKLFAFLGGMPFSRTASEPLRPILLWTRSML
jgi:hypothetical protein